MNCWKCGKPLDLPNKKISFRETCPHCDAYLHCCKNCIHYQPGLPNDCNVPGTDPIKDRETLNFCEEFEILEKAPSPRPNPRDILKKLFGEEI